MACFHRAPSASQPLHSRFPAPIPRAVPERKRPKGSESGQGGTCSSSARPCPRSCSLQAAGRNGVSNSDLAGREGACLSPAPEKASFPLPWCKGGPFGEKAFGLRRKEPFLPLSLAPGGPFLHAGLTPATSGSACPPRCIASAAWDHRSSWRARAGLGLAGFPGCPGHSPGRRRW